MGSKKPVHALEINPGPIDSGPTGCPSYRTVTTFRGSSSVLCRFPNYQFRVSELGSAVSVGFPIMILTPLLI